MYSKPKNQSKMDSPAATKYFNHHPSNFLNPYGLAADAPDAEKILRRIHPISCEWLKRPRIAMSEFAQTMVDNIEWLVDEGKDLVDSKKIEVLHGKMVPNPQPDSVFSSVRPAEFSN